MRIGIIGSGELGLTLAELWARAGHQVLLVTDDDQSTDLGERLSQFLIEIAAVDDAARSAEVIVLTGPFGKADAGPSPLTVVGKIVIDAMNAGPEDGADPSSSEATAERFPQARVVKALNTLPPEILRVEGRRSAPKEQRLAVVMSGDDARAKTRVSALIEEIGFTPVDAGTLARGGEFQQPGSDIFGKPMLPAEARMTLSLSR
ncbi:MAG: NADPH-dependent F420 reductase [Actinomycetota bacterium]